MTDQDKNVSNPQYNTSGTNPPGEDTQSRKRLRRLLAGSEENEAALSGSQPVKTGPPEQEPPASTAAPTGNEPTIPWPPPDQPVPDLSQTQRHPTGQPDSTGGWYTPGDSNTGVYGANPDSSATRPVSTGQPLPDETTRAIPRGSEPSGPPPGFTPPPPPRSDNVVPRRVEESDPNATQVTPAAYQSRRQVPPRSQPQNPGNPGAYPRQPANTGYPTYQSPPPQRQQGGNPPPPPTYSRSVGVGRSGGYPAATPVPSRPRASGWKRGLGCFLRAAVGLLFLVVFVVVAAGSWLVFQYFAIASDLPPVAELRNRASQFETTRILDRSGNPLYQIIDPNAGKRTFVPLNKISPYVVAATIATEDREFYNHPGFDPIAIARAFWQNYTTGEVVSGASTITQQLARALLLPDEQYERSYERKAREIVLAAEITRMYTKDEILELYLNEFNYGNLAYGIGAAAETYFNTTAEQLTLGQASFLAGIPQSPGVYDVYTNREATLGRQQQVILLMLEASQQKNCIYVSNRPNEPVCVNEPVALQAIQEIEAYNFQPTQDSMRYPHWVQFIRTLLEAQYDPQTIYRSGFTVYTTLDPALQDQAQAVVTAQIANLAGRNANNGALVAIRPATGEILAMVGSPDFYDDTHAGQINMAIAPRQPGSSIKPLTYVAAFEKGWTPSTLIWDVPTDFPPSGDPNDTRPPYQPVNYDGRYHGPVTVRSALANSFNIPAVKALQHVGIYGDSGLIAFAQRLGINTLNRPDYGLSLTLGGGEVTLLDMVSAFGTFGNNGVRVPPVAITKIVDYQGQVVYEYAPNPGAQVIRPEHAYLISSILSDNEARTPMFGPASPLALPFQVAAKTGTTNDFRDNWTVGYTPDLAVGVWIGNADYTEMIDVTGLTGAAPAWSAYMNYAVPALTNGNPTPFQRPGNMTERVICAFSGAEPSEFCTQQRTEIFAADQPPLPKEEDLWKRVEIDTWTGLRASAECAGFSDETMALNVTDPSAVRWIRETGDGQSWAASMGFNGPITFVPERECRASDPRPTIHIAGLNENQTITTSPLDVYVVVNATANFRQFRVEWGEGDDPSNWQPLVENNPNSYANPERVYSWNLHEIPAGRITLRVYMESHEQGRYAERRIHLNLNVPTPTPTMTPTSTITPTPTQTFTPTPTVPAPTNTSTAPAPTETTSPTP